MNEREEMKKIYSEQQEGMRMKPSPSRTTAPAVARSAANVGDADSTVTCNPYHDFNPERTLGTPGVTELDRATTQRTRGLAHVPGPASSRTQSVVSGQIAGTRDVNGTGDQARRTLDESDVGQEEPGPLLSRAVAKNPRSSAPTLVAAQEDLNPANTVPAGSSARTQGRLSAGSRVSQAHANPENTGASDSLTENSHHSSPVAPRAPSHTDRKDRTGTDMESAQGLSPELRHTEAPSQLIPSGSNPTAQADKAGVDISGMTPSYGFFLKRLRRLHGGAISLELQNLMASSRHLQGGTQVAPDSDSASEDAALDSRFPRHCTSSSRSDGRLVTIRGEQDMGNRSPTGDSGGEKPEGNHSRRFRANMTPGQGQREGHRLNWERHPRMGSPPTTEAPGVPPKGQGEVKSTGRRGSPSGIPSQGTQERDDASLNHIIELLRAIDVVKRRVLRGESASSRTTSSRDSENREELVSASTAMAGERAGSGIVVEKNAGGDGLMEKRETVLDVSVEALKKELKGGAGSSSGKVQFPALIKKLKELEKSLDVIIGEKNSAQAKVEQLSEENKMLMEKLESLAAMQSSRHRQSLSSGGTNATSEASELEQFNKSLEVYRRRIDELESQSKQSKKELADETAALKENHSRKLDEQRDLMQKEIDKLNEKLKSLASSNAREPVKELKSLQAKLNAKEEESEKLREELATRTEEMKKAAKHMEEKFKKREEELAKMLGTTVLCSKGDNEADKGTTQVVGSHKCEVRAGADDEEDEEQSVEDEEIPGEESAEQTSIAHHNEVVKEENDKLKQQLNILSQANTEKDELIERLQREMLQREKLREEFPRKDRSHSIASSAEHMSMCQKAARLHSSLTEQMSEKEENKEGSSKICSSRNNYFSSTAKDLSKSTRESPTASSFSWMTPRRSKSPSLLTSRLRERSPSKGKYSGYSGSIDTATSSSTRHRSLLSPPSDLADTRRRISPARQLYSSYKSAYEKSEKRPAWKF